MKISGQHVLAVEADVEHIEGGWIAISAPGSALRIAVTAGDRATAESEFARALKAWAAHVEAARAAGQKEFP